MLVIYQIKKLVLVFITFMLMSNDDKKIEFEKIFYINYLVQF